MRAPVLLQFYSAFNGNSRRDERVFRYASASQVTPYWQSLKASMATRHWSAYRASEKRA